MKSETDIAELIAQANQAERERIEARIDQLEDQRRELVAEYEATRDALVEELRPLRRWVANRQQPVIDDSERAVEQRRLEEELREVRQRFRRERQEVERELVEAREALQWVGESEVRMEELVAKLSEQ